MEGILLGAVMTAVALVLTAYMSNRSRCSLEQAVVLSGCSEQELQELIKKGWLGYRRQYLVVGSLSFDPVELADVRTHYPEYKRAQAESDATIRRVAEEAAARIAEANRRLEEESAVHQAEMEMLRQVHAEILKTLRLSLMPPEVAAACALLGVRHDAPFDEIHQQYRLLAKHHHPDAGGDHQQFIRIHNAYTCVKAWISSQR